jgi:hypothetical protein
LCTFFAGAALCAGALVLVRRLAVLGQQRVQVLGDLGLDGLAEGAQQEAQLGVQVKVIRRNDELAADAAARELHGVAGVAFDHRAFHVEFLLDLFGPAPGDLAGLGQAQAVFPVDADVGHGVQFLAVEVLDDASAARRSALGRAARRCTSA